MFCITSRGLYPQLAKSSSANFDPHPRKGVTEPPGFVKRHFGISIHAPARGVTGVHGFPGQGATDFNPHPAWGVTGPPVRGAPHKDISIHTPARGVTVPKERAPSTSRISIHTPARGVTRSMNRRQTM